MLEEWSSFGRQWVLIRQDLLAQWMIREDLENSLASGCQERIASLRCGVAKIIRVRDCVGPAVASCRRESDGR
jgi:hypothetical protein